MGYFDTDYYDECYEPSAFDDIANEAFQKMQDCLKQQVKDYYNNIQKDNERLKKENEELKNREHTVRNKELELESKIRDLERTFTKSKFSEMLKPFEKEFYIYYADSTSKLVPKCNQCDENRQITFTSPSGKTILRNCECNKRYTYYKPVKTKIISLWLHKDGWNNRPFTISAKYQDTRDDEHYCDFKILEIIDKFNEEEVKSYNPSTYGNSTGFLSKEECKKYCDWLNKDRGYNTDEDLNE
jgi:hypothetical protein